VVKLVTCVVLPRFSGLGKLYVQVSQWKLPFREAGSGRTFATCELGSGTSRQHTEFPRSDNMAADEAMLNGICVNIELVLLCTFTHVQLTSQCASHEVL